MFKSVIIVQNIERMRGGLQSTIHTPEPNEGPRTGREAQYHVPRVGGSQIRACETKKKQA